MLPNIRYTKNEAEKATFYNFDSLQHFGRWIAENLTEENCHYSRSSTEWATGIKGRDAAARAAELLKEGDLSAVPKATKLLEKFSTAIERDLTQWELSQQGAFPAVPEYLSGEPLSMYQQVHVSDDRAPVRIVANVTMSGGISHETIMQRGIAVLALVMKLSEIRPVTLELLNSGSDESRHASQGLLVGVPTAPLDLAHAAFAISSTAWTRFFGYSLFHMHEESEGRVGWDGGWPWGIHPDGDKVGQHEERMRRALKMEELDIYLPPMHVRSPEVKNPTKFIQDAIKRYLPE